MADESQKTRVAVLLGVTQGMHDAVKQLDAEGLPEADMICCALEDLFSMLEPVLGVDPVVAIARNG